MVFRSRKGAYFFLLDVLLGVFIFVITILLLATFRSHQPSLEGAAQTVDNVYTDLYLTEIKDIGANNVVLESLKQDGYAPNTRITLDEFIFYLKHRFIEENGTINGTQLWKNYTYDLVEEQTSWLPSNYGLEFYLGNLSDPLYVRNASLDVAQSTVKLSRKKIVALAPSIDFIPDEPEISEVIVWQ